MSENAEKHYAQKYRCKDCKKEFPIPAMYVVKDPDFAQAVADLPPNAFLSRCAVASGYEPELRTPCCPFCCSRNIEERRGRK